MLGMALVACGVQALAFLLTGSVLAPVVAHIILHVQLVLGGHELPPASQAVETTHMEPRRTWSHVPHRLWPCREA
jgi:hypothetical protein